VRTDRDVPGPSGQPEFAGELRDELMIARAQLEPLSLARPMFYLTRHEQHYSDSMNEPTHVVTSAGAIVGVDVTRFVPGMDVSVSLDYSEVDSSDSLAQDLGEHSRGSASVVASQIREQGPVSVAIELAATHTDDFGAALSGAVGASAATEMARAWVSLGSAYRPPTINQLYWPEDVWTGGNEDLDPERVLTVEAGVEGKLGGMRGTPLRSVTGSLSGYVAFADDLIAWAPADTTGVWRPMNVGEARMRGVELSLAAAFGPFSLEYSGDFSSAEDEETEEQLQYRPESAHWFGLGFDVDPVAAQVRLRHIGSVYVDDFAGRIELPRHTVVDFALLYDLPFPNVALRFDALNLVDESYQTRLGYDMPGREWRASLLVGWSEDGGSG
jgi:outer membrane cobalamin receptor